MSDASKTGGPFDLERVRILMELMEKHGLSEVSLRSDEQHWRFRRGPQEVVQVVGGGYAAAPVAAAPAFAPQAAASVPATTPAATVSAGADAHAGTVAIKSPQVGTFYSSPSPDDPPYVSVGTKVTPKTVVCQVEAMKVFNQIEAEVNGTIVEVLVKNGDSVEFGQPMFRVKPG